MLIYAPALGRFYLDGGVDTFIDESAANTVRIVTGGSERANITSTGLALTGTIAATSGTLSAQGETLAMNGAATNVIQITMGSTRYGSVGTAYSSASLCVVGNAYQTSASTDSWTQSSANPSLRLKSDFIGDKWYWQRSPSGTGAAVDATFWNTTVMTLTGAGALTITGQFSQASATFAKTTTTLTNGAAAQAGTLANAPLAGNPTKWVPIDDNGTTRYIPCW